MLLMAKKPEEPAARQTIQMPAEWHRALIRLAGHWKQQKIWAICRLIGEACEAEGIDHPPYPWDEMKAEAESK